MPSDTPGTDRVTSRGTWHCPLRMLIIRRASTSLRGALTDAHPTYVSWLNTTLSSSGMGLPGLPSDDDSSPAKWQWKDEEKRKEINEKTNMSSSKLCSLGGKTVEWNLRGEVRRTTVKSIRDIHATNEYNGQR